MPAIGQAWSNGRIGLNGISCYAQNHGGKQQHCSLGIWPRSACGKAKESR